jgi:hypothetical protein
MEEQKKVVLDKDALDQFINNFPTEYEFEAPELAELLSITEGVPILKVKPASLDDRIQARKLYSKPLHILHHIAVKVKDGEEVTVDDFRPPHPEGAIDASAYFEIKIFHKCVIEPKFTMEEVINMSTVFPELINRAATFIMELNQWPQESLEM